VETITANQIDIQKIAQTDPNIFVLEYLPEDSAWLPTIRQLRQTMPRVYILVLENEVIPSLPEHVLADIFSAGANEVYSKSVLSLKFIQTLERAKSWITASQGK
jgi:DNA-binding NarL/FixJ family response regulator